MNNRYLLMLLFCTLLGGCANKTETLSEEERLSAEYQLLASQKFINKSAVRQIGRQAQKQAYWPLYWQVQLELCQLETDVKSQQAACDRAYWALQQIPLQDQQTFLTYLSIYNALGETAFLDLAKSQPQSALQKLQLSLSTNKLPSEAEMQSAQPGNAEWATWFYLQGKQQRNLEILTKSQTIYTQLGWHQHSADSLFLMAKIAREQGQKALALRYATESMLILDSLNNQKALAVVKDWLDAAKPIR